MVIIYNCYGGTHSSVLSAAVHLKKLPCDKVPEKKEIRDLEHFNKLKYSDMGKLVFHGTDDEGNKVYTIGRGTSKVLIPALISLASETNRLDSLRENYIFVNCSPTVPAVMTVGGFFARGLHIGFLGVPLLLIGAQQTHFNIVRLVNKTKELCRQKPADFQVIDIDDKGSVNYYS